MLAPTNFLYLSASAVGPVIGLASIGNMGNPIGRLPKRVYREGKATGNSRGDLLPGGGMNREEYAAWVQAVWEKDVMRKALGAKASRSLRASLSQSKKDMARAKRSLAASEASSKRKLNKSLADLERAARERREASDREFEEARWKILMDKR